MKLNPRVKEATPEEDYRLRITFTNGETGIYDCRHLLDFGVFKKLRDVGYFRQVRAADGTVTWPHEQDICPDTIYLDSIKTGRTVEAVSESPFMEMIKKRIKVSNSKRAALSFEGDFSIDEEIIYSLVPEDLLNEIQVQPAARRTLTLADGRQETRPLGFCDFQIDGSGEAIPCPVIFAPKGSPLLLGATALDNFGLEVDLARKQLSPKLVIIGGCIAPTDNCVLSTVY